MSHPTTSRREQLHQALEAFSRSARFPLFKGVQVGRLMPEGYGPLGGFAELTFEELLAQVHAVGDAGLPIEAEQEEGLLHLLHVLGEDAGEPAHLAPDDDISIVVPDSFSSIDIPTLDEDLKRDAVAEEDSPPSDLPVGSVPLELALRASLSKIVSHQGYALVQKRTIGEFWDPAWTSAPFEEAMSIEQLAGLDLAVLFKKRMVTDTRIQGILRALGRVLSHLNSDVAAATTERSPEARVLTAERAFVQGHAPRSDNPLGELPVTLSAAASAVWEILAQASAEGSLARTLCHNFSLAECTAIATGAEVSATTMRDLRRFLSRVIAAQSLELVDALLRAPAVRIDHIAAVLFAHGVTPSAHTRVVASIVARGLGAVPVSLGGAVCEGFWTMDLPTLQTLVRGGRQGGRSGRRKVLVGSQLDPFLQKWIQAQGAGKSRRKESRNRLKHRRRTGK